MTTVVLIPCHNEEPTIGSVVDDFRREQPDARIYVYDNNSTDATAEVARAHGATVRAAPCPGKGMVIQQMFDEVDADLYVLVDGDATYSAADAGKIIEPVASGTCDMCVGNRLAHYTAGAFPWCHIFGNRLIRVLTRRFHQINVDDMLSGFRVMNRALVDDLCLISAGFEVETEINIKAIRKGFRIHCIPVQYSRRPDGSESKIRTLGDGYRILATLFMLLQEYQPLTFSGIAFLVLGLPGTVAMVTGLARESLFLFCGGLGSVIMGSLALCTGAILHAINMASREAERHRDKCDRRNSRETKERD